MKKEFNRLLGIVCFLLFGVALVTMTSCGGGSDAGGVIPACSLDSTAEVRFENQFVDKTLDVVWDGHTILTLAPGETSTTHIETAGVTHTSDFRDATTDFLACQTTSPNFATCSRNILFCGPRADDLIGNFTFKYQDSSIFTDRITVDTRTTELTGEGTYVYRGYNADNPSVTEAAGAWYPSLSAYVLAYGTIDELEYTQAYRFTINSDNTLSGCTYPDCFSFIVPGSYKSPLGSWDASLLASITNSINFIEVFERKTSEVHDVQAQRNESASLVNGSLDNAVVSKMNELNAILKKNYK